MKPWLRTCWSEQLQCKALEAVSTSVVLKKNGKHTLFDTCNWRSEKHVMRHSGFLDTTVCYLGGLGKARIKLKEECTMLK